MSGQPRTVDPGPASLAELEARFRRECELLVVPPTKAWLEPRTDAKLGAILDVAIIGAGMAGLAAALALKCLGVTNVTLFDRAAEGVEGPWLTYARMEVLRSPPELAGPALGFASLTFRAWFEAQFGRQRWDELHRIPRTQWVDYLRWYRRMVGVRVENLTELVAIDGTDHSVVMTLRSAAGERRVAARRVVLANGRDGLGGAFVPAMFRNLDRNLWAHSSDDIDFAKLAGKTVGVIGAGASAVDNAAEALEHGAGRVAMIVRRPDVPRINKGMGIGSPGMWHGYQHLPLDQRWSIVQYIADQAIPPPRDSMLRCTRHANFALFTNCAPHAVRSRGGGVVLETSRGNLAFDFLVLATGFVVDWPRRPELAALRQNIALWQDRFTPPDGRAFEQAEDPFLGPGLEFQPREVGTGSWVERVHCFAFPGFLSHGPVTGDIPAISVGAERIAQSIAAKLFGEDFERNFARMQAWSTPELRGDEFEPCEDISPFLERGVSHD